MNTKKSSSKTTSAASKKSAAKAKAAAVGARAAKKTIAALSDIDRAQNTIDAAKKSIRDLREQNIPSIIANLNSLMATFIAGEDIESAATGHERIRLFGAGVRNYGFIEKTWDIVRDNPTMRPTQFNYAQFGADIGEFDEYRQLYFLLEKFMQVVNEAMLVRSDKLFRDALRVYGNLREMSRARVPGAEPLYRALLTFFRRRRTAETVEGEPTIKELEHDFNKLIHGHADGEIVVKNETPKVSGGKRTVIDEVNTGRIAVKKVGDVEIKE